MRFIRENIFLLSAAGAVILIGGIMLASSASIGGDVDEALSNRQKLSMELGRLEKEPVNALIVEVEERRVEAARAALRNVVDRNIAWNRRNYQPFKLSLEVEGRKQEVPAFPVDRQLYDLHNNLTFKAAEVYREEMANLLKSLHPVAAITDKEIEKEKTFWEKKLKDEWEKREAKRLRAAEAEEGDIADSGRERANTPAEGPPTQQRILAMANKALLLKHAQEGVIYAPWKALIKVGEAQPRVPPPIPQIWQAQLNYWVTKDIIAAISATNDVSAGLAKSRKETHSVLNAAVKELVEIRVDKKYVRGSKPKPGAATPGAAGAAGVVNSFTQRGSCQQYDVLHYKFTIVMPTRFLNALEQNLLNRNYHTILSVQITELPDIPAGRYYGTDPVMTVTLQGELLLLTAWARGRENDCKISKRDAIGKGKDPWRDFLKKLFEQGRQAKPSPGKHIWSLLSPTIKQHIARNIASRRNLDNATREKVIGELNSLLAGKEFYDKASWANVELDWWERALLDKLNKNTIQSVDILRLNRALLKTAFPNEIAESPYLPPMMPAEVDPTNP